MISRKPDVDISTHKFARKKSQLINFVLNPSYFHKFLAASATATKTGSKPITGQTDRTGQSQDPPTGSNNNNLFN